MSDIEAPADHHEYEKRRFFDWRLAISLTLLAAVGWIVVSGIVAQADNRVKSDRIGTLVKQLEDAQQRNAANNALFLSNQKRMMDYLAAQNAHQNALLVYLHEHGIKIPIRYIQVVPPPMLQEPLPTPSPKRTPEPRATPKATPKPPAPTKTKGPKKPPPTKPPKATPPLLFFQILVP